MPVVASLNTTQVIAVIFATRETPGIRDLDGNCFEIRAGHVQLP